MKWCSRCSLCVCDPVYIWYLFDFSEGSPESVSGETTTLQQKQIQFRQDRVVTKERKK